MRSMLTKLLIGILIGGAIGALMGHFGKCSSGGCPLTANPFRGAIYGGVMGLLIAFASGSTQPTASNHKEEQPAPGEGLIYIGTQEAFDKIIAKTTLPCLVDFYSDSCPPCRRLSPTIHALAEKYEGRAVICKINTASAQELSAVYQIQSIPAVLFFKDGNEVKRLIGLQPQVAYENVLDNLIKSKTGEE